MSDERPTLTRPDGPAIVYVASDNATFYLLDQCGDLSRTGRRELRLMAALLATATEVVEAALYPGSS